MKTRNTLLTGFLSIIIVLFIGESCTVHKRVHRKGWFVQWSASESGKQKKNQDLRSETSLASDHDAIHPDNEIILESDRKLEIPEAEKLDHIDPQKEDQIEYLKNPKVDKQEEVQDSTPREESQDGEEKQWTSILPLSIMGAGLLSFVLVLSIWGLLQVLVPIAFTALIGLGTFVAIKEIRTHQNGKSIKKQLLVMGVLIAALWGITTVVLGGASLGIAIILFVASIISIVIITKRKFKDETTSKPSKSPDSAATEDLEKKKTETTYIIPPLTIREAFPDETTSIWISFIFTLVIVLVTLLIAGLASLFNITLGGPWTLLLLIPLALLIHSIVLTAIRDKLYKEYLSEYLSKEIDIDEGKVDENSTASPKKTDLAAISFCILMLVIIGVVTVLLLL